MGSASPGSAAVRGTAPRFPRRRGVGRPGPPRGETAADDTNTFFEGLSDGELPIREVTDLVDHALCAAREEWPGRRRSRARP
ncbi:hypothetical protein FNH09_06880 [Streptomyces adustus]|uniref:Uncharacterized protein n=1 Tax=Streptomyces adustus TaxID=1609272 RepID=A0A5N8V780_9ACTN|nr:hypothetical protein [Streptomyces adustus]MPY31053.1 hypothetical protein [Streptomyces adustus]